MNMTRSLVTIGMLAATAAVHAEGWTILDGGWRISAGGVYASPVKANLRFVPVRIAPPVSGRTAAEAKALAEANVRQITKDSPNADINFPNGARINPWDKTRKVYEALHPGESGFGQTWNAWFPGDSLDGEYFTLASYDYSEVHDYSVGSVAGSDEKGMPGVNVELARNLYHNEEYHYGVDIAFGVSYFFKTDIFGMDRQYSSGYVLSGTYDTVLQAPTGVKDPWGWHDGGYGVGTYNGPGPVFDLATMGVVGTENYSSLDGYIRANGDYRQLDLILSGKPYYDVTDWLRIVGTLGLVVSRGQFDLDVTMVGPGTDYSRNDEYSKWDVSGLGGLGAQLSYDDWSLGVDFYARFLDDPVEVDDEIVRGEIEQSDWLLKVSLGYRF